MLLTIRDRFLLALQYQDFRTLWTANLLAGASAWALIVARGWVVYEITDSSLWVGLVTFMAMIPRVFATPIIGFIADRFDRQTVLSWTYALNLAHNIALAVMVTMGLAGPWTLVILALLNGTFRASQQITTQSLVPNLVPKEHLLNAVALNQATQQGSRLVGPAAIAPLLLLVNIEAAFWLCSGFYLLGLIQTLRISTRSRGDVDQSKSFVQNMMAGFIYVYSTPIVLAMVLLAVFHCSLTMSYESLLPVLSRESLSGGSGGANMLMMSIGAGALVSSIALAGVLNSAIRGRLFLILGIASGISYVAMGASSLAGLSMATAVILGVSTAGFMTVTHTIIQTIVPDGIRGRVSGVYNMHVGGSMAAANFLNGALSDWLNAPVVMAVTGIGFTLAIGLSVVHLPLRRIYFPKTAPEPVPA
jgi:MFS family permease